MQTKQDRIRYVNGHREATDHPQVPDTVTDQELARHERLIDESAPYGSDPWHDE